MSRSQINVTVGDLDGNVAKILEYAARAREQGCDIVAFPELAAAPLGGIRLDGFLEDLC